MPAEDGTLSLGELLNGDGDRLPERAPQEMTVRRRLCVGDVCGGLGGRFPALDAAFVAEVVADGILAAPHQEWPRRGTLFRPNLNPARDEFRDAILSGVSPRPQAADEPAGLVEQELPRRIR